MSVKTMKNNKFWKILIFVGVITLVFGVVIYNVIAEEGRHISMLKGMIIGMGSAFIGIGGINLLRNKLSTDEKLKAKAIELKDERHIQIMRISFSISSAVAASLFAVLTFVFVAMDYIAAAFMALGAMYIQLISFFIAYKYFSRKM